MNQGNKNNKVVAAVVDPFTACALRHECKLIELGPVDWNVKLRLVRPDFLFVESAWRGLGNRWKKKIASYDGVVDSSLSRLVRWCRRQAIPTVFWNKEDPLHFDRFVEKARLFDLVYTTDQQSVARYKRAFGEAERPVSVLMFAASRYLHTFAPQWHREDRIVFLGGWYDDLDERSHLMNEILSGVPVDKLMIKDRFFEKGASSFPEEFHPCVYPGVSAQGVCEEYRKYRAYLNINTISDSPTMFSRRVFEVLASGGLLISSPSVGMESMFGDSVAVVNDKESARAAVMRLSRVSGALYKKNLDVSRYIHAEHSWTNRLKQIYDDIGGRVL